LKVIKWNGEFFRYIYRLSALFLSPSDQAFKSNKTMTIQQFQRRSAPVNIVVIKYWGKETFVFLPTNSSLRRWTRNDRKTTTTIAASREMDCRHLWINGNLKV
jgi:mevalonate pyrophosphate decarboxylase